LRIEVISLYLNFFVDWYTNSK